MPGPVIVLTGASRGMGLEIARTLLTVYNARVATLQRSMTPELQQLASTYPDKLIHVRGDVSKPEDNLAVVEAAVKKWGELNGLVLNAGTLQPMGKLADVPLDALVPSLRINVLSALYLVQPALPHLRKSSAPGSPSRVIFVSSGASQTGYQAWGMYSLAKAGLNSLARTFAAEERDAGVAFLSIRPGVVDTDMQVQIRSDGPSVMAPNEMSKFNSLHTDGKLLPPDVPGSVIAGCAVGIPLDISGEYVNWEDERFAQWRKK